MEQFRFSFVHGVAFGVSVIDGVFIGALTLVTGGLESIAYWVFLALVARNAVAFPLASVQFSLNLLLVVCYLAAGFLDTAITDLERTTIAVEERSRLTELSDRARRRGVHPASEPIRTLPQPPRGGLALDERAFEFSPRAEIGLSDREYDPQYVAMRIALLVLLAACCYGVQALWARQRQAEEEAQEFALRQEQLRAAGRLAAEIAHQIKNPLGIINNAAFTLQRTVTEGKGNITQQVRIIREEVERSDRIITELMGYAQLAEGKVERLDVVQELERALAQVLPPGSSYSIEIQRDYATALPPLLMQRAHVAEVFVNLLQNAREVLNGHGIIAVAARYAGDYAVEVSIADNGPGIPEDLRERVFEAYFSTKDKGTGLGLAIVRHNVETYGGTVRVESEIGSGTRFVVTFPGRASMRLRA
jgi:signal transduction histidine kinase